MSKDNKFGFGNVFSKQFKESKQSATEFREDGSEVPKKSPKNGSFNSVKKFLQIGSIVFILLFLLFGVINGGYYTVGDSEYAVVTTFGYPSAVTTPGMHFKIPFVQRVKLVSKNIMGTSIGYDEMTGQSVERESLMITLDFNFINADFYIEYQVTDPIKYLYNSEDPVGVLKNLAQSYIRDTVGLYNVDEVLTTGKVEIQASIKEKLLNRLEAEDIGLQVINITVQDAEPPTEEVKNAFKAVETAKQGKETAINNANKYKNEKLPAANAQIDQILKSAEADKQTRINEAEGQVARFNALFEEYSKFPVITRQRMFYEAMEEILPDLKVYLMGDDGTQTLLPLESFTGAAAVQETQTPVQESATPETTETTIWN